MYNTVNWGGSDQLIKLCKYLCPINWPYTSVHVRWEGRASDGLHAQFFLPDEEILYRWLEKSMMTSLLILLFLREKKSNNYGTAVPSIETIWMDEYGTSPSFRLSCTHEIILLLSTLDQQRLDYDMEFRIWWNTSAQKNKA